MNNRLLSNTEKILLSNIIQKSNYDTFGYAEFQQALSSAPIFRQKQIFKNNEEYSQKCPAYHDYINWLTETI